MDSPKFEIGQKVKFINDSDNDAGLVEGMTFNGESWVYKITSKEVDHAKKEIISGFKTGGEDELVEVIEVKEEE